MSDEEDEKDSDEGEEAPHVIIGELREVNPNLEARLLKDYGKRPVWFMLEMDAELTTVFEQLPEDPMPKGHVDAIMGALRAFAQERSDALQVALGISDGLHFGFHTDATIDRVRGAFEADGFVIVGTLEGGDIALDDDEEEAPPAAPEA